MPRSLVAALAILSLLATAIPLAARDKPPAAAPRSAADDQRDAVWYILHGNYKEALRHLGGASTAGSSDAEAENLRGLAVMLGGDAAGALPHFERAIALDPKLTEARFNRGVAWLQRGDATRALADFTPIAADAGSALQARAAYHAGLAYEQAGRHDEAERSVLQAFALDPKYDAALLTLGVFRERRGDLQGAGKAYQQFLDRHPDSVEAMLRFGVAAQRAGRYDVAARYLRAVIERAPSSSEAAEARKYLVMWE